MKVRVLCNSEELGKMCISKGIYKAREVRRQNEYEDSNNRDRC